MEHYAATMSIFL